MAKPKLHPIIKRLVAYRKGQELSQPAFARLIDVPLGTLRRWEQGQHVPDAATLAFIKLFLDSKKS